MKMPLLQKKRLYAIACFAVLAVSGILFFCANTHIARIADAQFSVQKPQIVLDAGHGGEDGGTVCNGIIEKDVNLAVTQQLQALFWLYGADVFPIRETDCSVGDTTLSTVLQRKASDLHYRADFAQSKENALLLSIHQNYFEQPQYWGTQVFYSPNHSDSAVLAQSIQQSVASLLQPQNTRKIVEAGNGIYLLQNVTSPAVIVEGGFLSHPQEAKLLSCTDYQQQLAFGIFCGVAAYYEAGMQEKTA